MGENKKSGVIDSLGIGEAVDDIAEGSCSFAEPVADLHDMGWL